MRQHIDNIQILRAIAVLGVVAFHLRIVEAKYGNGVQLLPLWSDFGMSGVDLFFVISGFIMVYVTQNLFRSRQHAVRFAVNRFVRIYPLYWLFTLLVLGVYLIKPDMVNSSQGNRVDIVASFLLWPSDVLPLVMVGWTLIHEVYFYAVFFFFLWFLPERYLVHALVVWGAIVVAARLWLEPTSPETVHITHPLTLEFIAGALLARVYLAQNAAKRLVKRRTFKAVWIVPIVASYALSLYYFQHNAYDMPELFERVLLFGIPSFMLTAWFVFAAPFSGVTARMLIAIGNASYSIYLSHILTLAVVGRIWQKLPFDGVWGHASMLALMIAAVLGVGVLIYRYIEIPLIAWSKRKLYATIAPVRK